ncbi:Uncharacterised protein [Klebsiella pneumoniae]|nr:Uncharacterised protein [Klebsiella pneumoniae]
MICRDRNYGCAVFRLLFTMYFVTIKATADTIMPWMFAAGYFMAFTCHIFIEKLMVGASFKNPATASGLITPK